MICLHSSGDGELTIIKQLILGSFKALLYAQPKSAYQKPPSATLGEPASVTLSKPAASLTRPPFSAESLSTPLGNTYQGVVGNGSEIHVLSH